MKRLFLCFLSLILLSVNMSLAEIQDNSTHWILPLETTPSTYTDYQGVIYKLNSAKNAYTVTGHTDDFNLDITIPNQLFSLPVTAIGDDALGWSELQSLVLPEGIETIGMNAISDCQISSLHIPASVNSLYPNDDNTFSCNKRLASITVATGNTVYDSRNNCNAIIETSTNRLVSGCNNTIIPNTVTSIGNDAFFGCQFSTITLPSGITSIGNIAFMSCSQLKTIYALMKTPATLNDGAFESNHYSNATLYVPKGCKTAYQQANVWKKFQNIMEMDGDVPGGDNITMIDDSTFSALTFEGVRMVFKILDPVAKTVQVGNDTVSIDRSTAGTVTIPTFVNGYTVVGIGRSGFNSCAELTTVWLPDSLRFIGDHAFYGCTKLRTIQIPETVYGISESAFVGCSGLTNVSCPYIPGVNLGVVFPPSANLEIIGYKASDEDYDVVIPRLVNSIGQRTFSYCPSIRTMRVEEGNSVYDSRDNCNAIILTAENKLLNGCKNTIIPESVTAIESYAFEGHTGLVAIAIPAAVKTIGNGAFTACTGLTSVTSRIKTPYAIDDSVFSGQTYRTATLYVPVGTKALYQKANGWKNFLNIVEQEEVNPENCEPYAVYQDGVLTFYYDDKKGMREGTVYGLNEGYNYPGWYNDHRTDITKAVFDDSFAGARPTSTYHWFAVRYNETSNLTEIQGIQNLNTSQATSMNSMFYRCSSLTSLDVSHFDTSNVTNMGSMFNGCSGLTSLDVSHFDTSNVTYMGSMFSNCSSLTSLDVSHFDTGNATSMYFMFYGCNSLTSLDVSHFDTSNVTDMCSMFSNCSSLTSLDVSHFDTGKVTSMNHFFSGCSGLTSLDVSHFDTSNVTDMCSMFSNCSSLTSLDVSHFDTGKVTSMNHFFSGCSGLTSLDVSHFDTGKVTDMYAMFNDCSGLTSLDVSHFDTSNVTSMDFMFYRCSGLTSLDVSHFYTSNVIGMFAMFYGCSNLTSLDLSHFDTGNVTTMFNMFSGCSSLTSLDVNHFDTSNVTSMGSMFSGCSSLTSLDVSHFDTGNVTDMRWMFNGCSNLSIIYCDDTWTCSSSTNMFSNCKSLSGFNSANSNVDYAKPIDLGGYFTRAENNPNGIIDFADAEVKRICVENWDTNGDGELSYGEAAAVKEIDLEFYNSDIVSFDEFQYFKGLDRIGGEHKVKKAENSYVVYWKGFSSCRKLSSIILPLSLEKVDTGAFAQCYELKSIRFPANVTTIGTSALFYAGLENLFIPKTITSINGSPFQGCTLDKIIVEEGNQHFDTREDCNSLIETKSNTLIVAGIKSFVPSTIEKIEWGACSGMKIDSLVIPKSVKEIRNYGFSSSYFKTVTALWKEPINITNNVFSHYNRTLYVPYGCKAAYEAADYWKEFKEIIEMDGDNSLYADDVTVRPGVQKTVTLQLDNENTFVAGEFRLQLPAGMRMETDEDGEPVANLVSGRSNKHTLMVTDEGNGLYHFMFYSGQNRAILGNSGDFISLSVIADEGVEDGSYTAKLKNVFFSTEDEKRIDLPDVDFNINVLDYTPGDVNGDGSLNVMDVVKLVNYIMGRNPSDFVFAAADMDENDKINVMDLVNVVDIIMSTPLYAPAKSNNMASFSRLILDKTDKNIISMSVPEADRHIAAQFVVTLKGNAVLNDVLSDNDHQSEVTRMSDGRYKVMVYSGKNDVFKNNRPISLQLSGNSDVMIEDVVFVDADEEAVVYEPAMTNTTGIMAIDTEFSQPTDIYTVGGSLVKKNATSMHGLASGVYIVNNEKIVIK